MDRDQSPQWRQQNEEDEPISPRPLFRSHFMQRWLRRDETLSDTEEDEDEESESPVSKRFRKLFKPLFRKRIATTPVAAEAAESADVSTQGFRIPLDLASFTSLEVPHATEEDGENLEGRVFDDFKQETSELERISTDAPEDLPAVLHIEQNDPITLEAPEKPVAQITEEFHDLQALEMPIEQPISDEQPRFPFTNVETPAEVNKRGGFNAIPLTPPVVEASAPKPERSAAGPAVIGFLAGEFLSRRRDRKLKRRIKKLEREAQNERIKQAETAYRANRDTSEPEVQKQKFATKVENIAPHQPQEAQPKSIENQPSSHIEAKQPMRREANISSIESDFNQSLDLQPERVQRLPVYEVEPVAPLLRERQERLADIKRSVEARQASDKKEAPHHIDPVELTPPVVDKTPEAYYDRRHEILDEPGAAPQQPKQLNNRTKKTAQATRNHLSSDSSDGEDSNGSVKSGSNSALPKSPMYQQAIRSGFAAALALIVIGIIVLTIL